MSMSYDPNMTFGLGFVPTKEHQVVITSNGTNLTILMSVNKSKFIKIFSFEGADIKKGGIGVGTCKCQVKFGEMSMRPPKLALSEAQKRAIVNSNGNNIVTPKGAWVNESNDSESKFQVAQRKKEQQEKDKSKSSTNNTAWNSSSGGSKESGATNEVEKAQNAFNAGSNNGGGSNSNGDFTNMEVDNNLENGVTISKDKNGEAGWSSNGNSGGSSSGGSSSGGSSSGGSSSKSYSKDFVSGWEVCITNRTADQRTGYCNRINTAPLKKNCNDNFCDYCCSDRVGTGRPNVLHQCVKICNQSTASLAKVDGINKCINPTQENNVNSYCSTKMKGKQKGLITKCKLDMCNLCCSTLDAQEESKISNNATSSCYSHCSNKYNSNTDNRKSKELGSQDEEDRQ